jgi:multisubunit Na+/H+ antiporter MnhB subunit
MKLPKLSYGVIIAVALVVFYAAYIAYCLVSGELNQGEVLKGAVFIVCIVIALAVLGKKTDKPDDSNESNNSENSNNSNNSDN